MKLKESEVIGGSLDHLKTILAEFPTISLIRTQVDVGINGPPRASAILGLKISGKPFKLAVKAMALATPARLRAFLEQPYLKSLSGIPDVYRIVAAPFFSDDSIRLCREEGVGAVDTQGNCWLHFEGISVRYGFTARKAALVADRSISPLRFPKAQRVLQGLLDPDAGRRDWKMKDLASDCGVSLGQAFKVCRWLVEQEWADLPGRGRFKITRPESALDALASAYEPNVAEQQFYFSLESKEKVELALAKTKANAILADKLRFAENTIAVRSSWLGRGAVLSGFSAARHWAPFVRHLRTQIYVPGRVADLIDSDNIKLEPAEQGANVVFTVPKNDNAFFGVKNIDGVEVTSLVQTYLDLTKEPLRGEDAAEKVKEFWLKQFEKGSGNGPN